MSNSRRGSQMLPRRTSAIQPIVSPGPNDPLTLNPSRLLQNPNINNPNDMLRNPQIQNIVSQSTDQDVLFYEYEIVDKKAEDAWAKEKIRSKGLCVCQRWVCMLIGNIIIIAIVCGLIGLMVYLNSSTGSTKQPKSYLESCTMGSSDCDSVADLKCPNGTCLCNSNKAWNGTDCACLFNYYWDGFNCVSNKQYGESCSKTVPCMDYMYCDSTSSQCSCSNTTYYTNNSCVDKKISGKTCTSYVECKTYLGLTCTSGSCACYSRFYWNNVQCVSQQLESTSCTTFPTIQCDSTLGLSCISTKCSCATGYFWTGSKCQIKGVYGVSCGADSHCDSTRSLICSVGSFTCSCPTTYGVGTCDCNSSNFWDGQNCISRKSAGSACPGGYGCTSGSCVFGVCQ